VRRDGQEAAAPQEFQVKVAPSLARLFAYLQRFSIACENFGVVSAIRLFYYCRFKSFSGGVSLRVRKLRRDVVFRGKTDKGVMSHFFSPGYRILDTVENPVRVIVDAGANIGDETLRFRHFHPDARIVAIEPDPGNFNILSANVASDSAIELLNNGLWSHDCGLCVIAGDSAEGFRVEEADDRSQPPDVEAISIPSIMARFSLSSIDILKMDIEGSEFQVFSSPSVESWIGGVKVLIFECPDSDHPGATQRIFEKIAGLNFDCHIHGECLVLIRRDTGWRLESNLYL
jgi:FkbM family methyltransferase